MKQLLFTIALFALFLSCKKEQKIQCTKEIDPAAIQCYSKNVNDSINGFIINYHADGKTKESEGNYENGVQKGFWKFYYQNGNILKEGNFANGKITGFWKLYYDNGLTKEEGDYQDCQRDGLWRFYYNDISRQIESEGSYEHGIKEGRWKYYDQNGKLVEEKDC